MDYTCPTYWSAVLNASLCKFFILRAVCLRPGHGYEIIRRVARLTGNLCEPTQGTVYPVLREFEKCGCVHSRVAIVHGRERRVYSATPKGRRALQSGLDVWQRALVRLRRTMNAPKPRSRRS